MVSTSLYLPNKRTSLEVWLEGGVRSEVRREDGDLFRKARALHDRVNVFIKVIVGRCSILSRTSVPLLHWKTH